MGFIEVGSQEMAIIIARQLTQAANAVYKDFDLSDIEQAGIVNTLCSLRDNIKIVKA